MKPSKQELPAVRASDPEEAPSSALAELQGGEAWRGDEHELRVEAAREAGLETRDVELDFFTEGFKVGMTLDDPDDRAIVLRGRTVLHEQQMRQ